MSNGNESIHSTTRHEPMQMGCGGGVSPARDVTTPGLTKREYFAALCMARMVKPQVGPCKEGWREVEEARKGWAVTAVASADALLAALEVK